MPARLYVFLGLAVLLAGCTPSSESASSPAGPAATSSGSLVVRGGTLVDGTGAEPIPDAVVVVRAGTVRAAGAAATIEEPSGARVIDAAGRYLVPGYVDAHVHYSQSGWFDGRPDAADLRDRHPYPEVVARLRGDPDRYFRAYLCSGVTATFDVGGYPWTRSHEDRGRRETGVPRVAAAGPLLSTIDFWLNLPGQKQFVYMSDEQTVRRAVRSHAALGSSAVKVWFITPPEPPDSSRVVRLVEAAGSEAEEVGLPLVVHATGLWEAKAAIRAGADVLVHSVFDRPVDAEFLDLARESDAVYTTTLTVREGYRNAYRPGDADRFPYPVSCVDSSTRALVSEPLPDSVVPPGLRAPDRTGARGEIPQIPDLRTGLENLRRVHEAGIPVAAGTDAGNPGTLHGPSIYREMELLAEGGLMPMEVLVASTRNAARAMGRDHDLGTVEVGKHADLVILEEDPLEDVGHLRSVRTVVKGGAVWSRSSDEEKGDR